MAKGFTGTDLLGAALYAGALGGAGSWLGVRLFILARLAAGLLLEVLGGDTGDITLFDIAVECAGGDSPLVFFL